MNLIRRFLLAAALLLGATLPAPATILFAGGEDVNVTFVGISGVTTTAGTFRAGYAREAISVNEGGGVDPPINYFYIPAFTPVSTLWMHAEVQPQIAGTLTDRYLAILDAGGVARVVVRGVGGSTPVVKLSKRNAAGTYTDLATCTAAVFPVSTIGKLDLYLNYATSGHVSLYWNGTMFCDYAGDVTTDGATAVDDIQFSSASYFGGTSYSTLWSEIIISTTDTRNLNLVTLAPTANGTNMAWTGAYTNVNPTTINDASFIYTGSNSQVAEFTTGALPSGTAWTVVALSQTARLLVGATGPSTASFILRPATGSTDYPLCAGTAPITSFANYSCITALNPASSAAWAPADLGTGFNAGVESTP